LDDALDRSVAFCVRTGIAGPAVNPKTVLKITKIAIGLAVVAQRRSTRFDRFDQHLLDDLGETPGLGGGAAIPQCQSARRPARREIRAEQGLADINIAKTGDQRLIEQRGLEQRGLSREQPGQGATIKAAAQRLDAEIPEQRMVPTSGPQSCMKPNRRGSL